MDQEDHMKSPNIVLGLCAVLAAAVVLIVVYPVAAGTGYVLKCSNCKLKTSLHYGRGKASKTVAVGYCCGCDKFVRVGYNLTTVESDEERQKLETPIGHVFCHESGTKHALYACPECSKPFIAIERQAFGTPSKPKKIHCPKCSKQTLETAGVLMWD
jgi:DNA-directed RNA polymerase subunit RPC12/RpoP